MHKYNFNPLWLIIPLIILILLITLIVYMSLKCKDKYLPTPTGLDWCTVHGGLLYKKQGRCLFNNTADCTKAIKDNNVGTFCQWGKNCVNNKTCYPWGRGIHTDCLCPGKTSQ